MVTPELPSESDDESVAIRYLYEEAQEACAALGAGFAVVNLDEWTTDEEV